MYQVEFRPRAARDFGGLDQADRARILKKLRWLAENFETIQPEPLIGQFSGLFKLRVGAYRVIYQPDREKMLLTIRRLGHRREIYEQLS